MVRNLQPVAMDLCHLAYLAPHGVWKFGGWGGSSVSVNCCYPAAKFLDPLGSPSGQITWPHHGMRDSSVAASRHVRSGWCMTTSESLRLGWYTATSEHTESSQHVGRSGQVESGQYMGLYPWANCMHQLCTGSGLCTDPTAFIWPVG